MISKPIIKQLFKSNVVTIAIFTGILLMYQTILIFMYTPSMIDQMTEMMKSMGNIGGMYGMDKMTGGYSGYIAQFYFAMIVPMFMLVYGIMTGNKIIAGRVDKGSMACLLASPNTRNAISISSAVFYFLSIVVIVGINTVIGLICTLAYKEADISIKHFLFLNVGVIIMIVGMASISFFFSCVFNESKRSIALGGGIPIVFFLFYMISDMGEKLEVFKKITLYSLFKATDIVNDNYTPVLIGLGILTAMSIILVTAGVRIFNKKDLPV